MKETQRCDRESKMKVKNEDGQASPREKAKGDQASSFENNLSERKMTKDEQEANSKEEKVVVKDDAKTAETMAIITTQVKELKICKSKGDDIDVITSQVNEICISSKPKDADEKTSRQNSIDSDGKVFKNENGELVARGPNGGKACHDYDNYNLNMPNQYEMKCGSNKRSFLEDTEPAKYYRPINNLEQMTIQNQNQYYGGVVNIKQSPVMPQVEPFVFENMGENGNFVDSLIGDNQNIESGFLGSNCMAPNIYQPQCTEDVLPDDVSVYSNKFGGPPSNHSTDSGFSSSENSPYQEIYSPQSQKSNASPPHEVNHDIPTACQKPINTPLMTAGNTVRDFMDGREDDFEDAIKIITKDLIDSKRPARQIKELPMASPAMSPNLSNSVPVKPVQPQPPICSLDQPNQVTSTQMFTSNQLPTTTIITAPCMMNQQAVVPPFNSNPVMMMQPTHRPIPVTTMPPYTQPQIIIISPTPVPAPKRPLRPIAPKKSTTPVDNKKAASPNSGKQVQGQRPIQRNEQVPIMSVKPTPATAQTIVQPPNNNTNIQNKHKMLNLARRMVADIPREQLPYQDEEGDTYLHVAACKTDTNLIQALLERLHRENMEWLIDLENKKRMTPLYLAVLGNQPDMVDVFLKDGANPNSMAQSVSSDGKSMEVKAPIHVAAAGGEEYLSTLKKLLNFRDITLNIANSEGHTALHTAIIAHGTRRSNGSYVNSMNTIEALIKAGADPNLQDKKSGKTPLMYAIEKRDYILIEKMLRLFDPKKLRNVIKSQTFDGSNCLKIAEGRKSEFNPQDWQRLWDLLNKACTGELPRAPVMLGAY